VAKLDVVVGAESLHRLDAFVHPNESHGSTPAVMRDG
jgi:hypothetical protein